MDLGLRLGLRMDFLLCPILRPNILAHILFKLGLRLGLRMDFLLCPFLGLIFWVTFCSNRNTLTFDSNSYKKTNLSGVKIVVIVSPLPLVDAHTKICPKY